MENPTNTPSAAQQAENNGSERMFSQSELKCLMRDGRQMQHTVGGTSKCHIDGQRI